MPMKVRLSLWLILSFLLVSCVSEDMNLKEADSSARYENLSEQEKNVIRLIQLDKNGCVGENQQLTRIDDEVSLRPLVQGCDTLCFIAQYEDGWAIYSPTTAAPAVLFRSEKGKFDMDGKDMPPALRELIQQTLKSAVALKKSAKEAKVHPSWGIFAATPDDLNNSVTYKVSRNGRRMAVSENDLPPGKWVLIRTEVTDEIVEESPKYIKTKWNQPYPWNMYAKYVLVGGSKRQCPAGCVAVALSQYFYYTHFKDGVPRAAPATAVITSDGLDYTFSNYTSEAWSVMPLRYDGTNANSYGMKMTAMLLGDVGRKVNSIYTWGGTSSGPKYSIPYMNQVYGKEFIRMEFNRDKAIRSLKAGYPLVSDSRSNMDSNGNLVEDAGHYFLIDHYQKENRVYTYTYGYEFDPWRGEGGCPWEDNERDEWGNIVSYNYEKEVVNTYEHIYVSMNWGYGGANDDTLNNAEGVWDAGNRKYNYNHCIHLMSDFQ